MTTSPQVQGTAEESSRAAAFLARFTERRRGSGQVSVENSLSYCEEKRATRSTATQTIDAHSHSAAQTEEYECGECTTAARDLEQCRAVVRLQEIERTGDKAKIEELAELVNTLNAEVQKLTQKVNTSESLKRLIEIEGDLKVTAALLENRTYELIQQERTMQQRVSPTQESDLAALSQTLAERERSVQELSEALERQVAATAVQERRLKDETTANHQVAECSQVLGLCKDVVQSCVHAALCEVHTRAIAAVSRQRDEAEALLDELHGEVVVVRSLKVALKRASDFVFEAAPHRRAQSSSRHQPSSIRSQLDFLTAKESEVQRKSLSLAKSLSHLQSQRAALQAKEERVERVNFELKLLTEELATQNQSLRAFEQQLIARDQELRKLAESLAVVEIHLSQSVSSLPREVGLSSILEKLVQRRSELSEKVGPDLSTSLP